MAPRSTASLSTSSIRSRVSITMSIGRMRFLRSASRNSATVFASTPARRAGVAAVLAVLLAALRARCCRPRAWPPFFAAAARFVELVLLRGVLAPLGLLGVPRLAIALLLCREPLLESFPGLEKSHPARLGRQPAGPLHHAETAHEQMVDGIGVGGSAQVETPAQPGEGLGFAPGAEVEVAPEHERVAVRPLHRALGGPLNLGGRLE